MKKTKVFILLTLFVPTIFSGCVPPQKDTEIYPTEQTYSKPFDKVWSVMIEVLASDKGYPVSVVEKASGLIQTDFVSIPLSEMRPFVNTATTFITMCRLKWTIYIKAIEGGTKVKVTPHIEYFFSFGDTSQWMVVKSNTRLEHDILMLIGEKLGIVPAPEPITTPETEIN